MNPIHQPQLWLMLGVIAALFAVLGHFLSVNKKHKDFVEKVKAANITLWLLDNKTRLGSNGFVVYLTREVSSDRDSLCNPVLFWEVIRVLFPEIRPIDIVHFPQKDLKPNWLFYDVVGFILSSDLQDFKYDPIHMKQTLKELFEVIEVSTKDELPFFRDSIQTS